MSVQNLIVYCRKESAFEKNANFDSQKMLLLCHILYTNYNQYLYNFQLLNNFEYKENYLLVNAY